MLKIRLRRVGKRNQPSYRVVVVEHTTKVQGSYLENLGNYNPRANEFAVKQDRVLHWLSVGAQPSERMAKLLTKAGVTHKQIVLPDYDRKPKRKSKKAQPEAPVAEQPAEPTADEPTTDAPESTDAEVNEAPVSEPEVTTEPAAADAETPAAEPAE